jgi:hypothetical protein
LAGWFQSLRAEFSRTATLNFCFLSVFSADAAFLPTKTAEILALKALSPFSKLGCSLTLAPWFTQSGAFTRRHQVNQTLPGRTEKRRLNCPEVKLMKKAPRQLLLPAHTIVRRHA